MVGKQLMEQCETVEVRLGGAALCAHVCIIIHNVFIKGSVDQVRDSQRPEKRERER